MKYTAAAIYALTGVALLSSSALAADLYTAPPVYEPVAAAPAGFSWTGFHVGVSGGYGGGSFDPQFENNGFENVLNGNPPANQTVTEWYDFGLCDDGPVPFGGWATYCGGADDVKGWFGGGQVGYDHQFGGVVLGVEADAFWSDLNGDGGSIWSYDYGGPDFGNTDTNISTKVEAFGTIRARVGVPIGNDDRLMPYVSGGAAWGKIDVSASSFNFNASDANTFFGPSSTSETKWGWSLGAGAAYALTNNIILKGEYMYIDLGEHTANFSYNDGGPYNLKQDIDFHTVKVGIDFKF